MEKIYFGKNVTITNDNMFGMFKNNTSLKSVYNIPDSVTKMNDTFFGCITLENIGKLPSSLVTAKGTFSGCKNFNQDLDSLGFLNLKNLTDCTGIFLNNIMRTGTASFPTSVTTATQAFANTKITEVNFNNNLSYQIQNLYQTFQNCKKLITCNRIPSSVINLNYSFQASTLQELPTFNNSTCQMAYSFNQTNIKEINKDLPLSYYMPSCFAENDQLKTVNATCFHLGEDADTEFLFYKCSNLSTINGELTNAGNCSYAFQGCSSLTALNISGITECIDFIKSATEITFLSIKGRIVKCGTGFFATYDSIASFLNQPTDNSTYRQNINNLITLLSKLKSDTTINISGADFPVDVAIFQALETGKNLAGTSIPSLPEKLYLSSFDLNDYNSDIDDNNNIITLKSPKSNFNKGNIILPSKYYTNRKQYKIKPSEGLFDLTSTTVDLYRVISALSEYSSYMFSSSRRNSSIKHSNLTEFTFLQTSTSADLTTIPDSWFYNCPNVNFFNLDYLRSLTTIGANAFYNSINQDIKFNSDKTITVNENAFYRKKKSIVTLNLNRDSSKKLDQSYYFEFPYNKQSDDSFAKQIHASFLIKNPNLDEPIKDMLDKNVNIIKLINFNNIINYIQSFTSPQFFEKKDGTIIDNYSDGFSIDTINLTDFKKIYVLSDYSKDRDNWAWAYYNLYWLVFERVN